ncbi:sulfotransferase [Alcanivorax sp. S6407]|uniref:sulfotransferase family protein n=1 Tax=Alcanivorax sp. S6407 TaxID=2926424 RepID=UPI001FF2502F|nr:sulfotransferase [Alcanivorax sp. S6407]
MRKYLSRKVVFDSGVSEKDTVFLAGMGRSGSTFLSNLINYKNTYRVMFEPFRSDLVSEAEMFVNPTYLRPDHKDADLFASARNIISGNVSSDWINKENKAIFPSRRLIKDIRANFFLKWLNNNFPEMKIVLLVRHPCAVIDSWLRSGFGDGSVSRRRLIDNVDFVSDIEEGLIKEYLKADTDIERLAFLWAFNYFVPFQQFSFGEIKVVFYESLVLSPENEIREIYSFISDDFQDRGFSKQVFSPSSTTSKDQSFFEKGVRLDGWRKDLSMDDIKKIDKVMGLFGFGSLYSFEDGMPNPGELRKLINP